MAILLVAAGGSIIYGLPYFHYDYYEAYAQAYHLTNTQIGVFGSIFGVFGMISYLFGGYLADRVSIRLLLSLSLIGTGLGGFIHLLPLNFPSSWPCTRSGASPRCSRFGRAASRRCASCPAPRTRASPSAGSRARAAWPPRS